MGELRFIDLFAGIGGFRIGLERANQEDTDREASTRQNLRSQRNSSIDTRRNAQEHVPLPEGASFRCVWSNDINKYASTIYTNRFGEANHITGDIRAIDESTIPSHDLLCAGFPCQAFSVAGKRRGFKETRGTLFFEICRIAEHHRPRLLLLENVKGLLSHDGGRTFATILEALEELGYWWEYQVLNSKHFGVPQNRERVFIIGHSRNGGGREIFPITETDGVANQNGRGRSPVQAEIGSAIHSRYGAGWRAHGQEQLISTAIDGNYYKGIDKHGQRQGIIVESALIHSRGLETRRDGVSHCLKGGGGGSSKNMLVEPYIKNIPHGHNDGWKKPLPSLKSNSGAQYNELLVQPVLTPDRENKRQHGRRFKENGEPMFTLTGQDKHGVLLHNIYGGFNEGIRVFEDYSPTIRTPKGGGHLPSVLKDSRIRRLTPCECERLQGFPDGWTEGISDTQRYKCLGNAVTVNVIEFLGHKLLESVNSTSKRLKENVFVDLDFKDVEIRVK